MFLMANSLAHTKWVCKYHIVFTPKYRRKIIYKELRKDIQQIIKDLCKQKGVEIIEGHIMPDHSRVWKQKLLGDRIYYINTLGINTATIQKYIPRAGKAISNWRWFEQEGVCRAFQGQQVIILPSQRSLFMVVVKIEYDLTRISCIIHKYKRQFYKLWAIGKVLSVKIPDLSKFQTNLEF